MTTAAFLAMALQLLPALPPPDRVRWEMVLAEGDATFEIDPATIERDGEIARYTVRLPVLEPGDSGVRLMILRHAMNCRTRQVGIVAADGYGADGRLVRTRESGPGEIVYEDYPAGADADRLHERVCGITTH